MTYKKEIRFLEEIGEILQESCKQYVKASTEVLRHYPAVDLTEKEFGYIDKTTGEFVSRRQHL